MNKYQTMTWMYDDLNHLWMRNSLQFGAVHWNYFKHVCIMSGSSWVRITRLLPSRIVKSGAQLSLPQKSCRREGYVCTGLAAQWSQKLTLWPLLLQWSDRPSQTQKSWGLQALLLHRDQQGVDEATALILRLFLSALLQLATEKQPVINAPKRTSKMEPVSALLSWDGCKASVAFSDLRAQCLHLRPCFNCYFLLWEVFTPK